MTTRRASSGATPASISASRRRPTAGLMVPVVRHAEARDLWDCAAELTRLAEAARTGTATREELTGSTITITSPRRARRHRHHAGHQPSGSGDRRREQDHRAPEWDGHAFVPRKMMNLSSSFDHRVIDGWDAAVFVQRMKALLETPAMIFMEG